MEKRSSAINIYDHMPDKRLIVFGVGMSANSDEYTEKLKHDNITRYPDVPLFYLRGAFDKDKLGFFARKAVGMVIKPLRNKMDDPNARELVEMYDNNISYVSDDNLNDLVKEITSVKI